MESEQPTSDDRPDRTRGDTLASRLGEGPIATDLLWRAYWGEANGGPAILADLARDLLGPRSSHVLIYGRYGVGKTSFLMALRSYLGSGVGAGGTDPAAPPASPAARPAHAAPRSQDTDTPQVPLQLWLHMPLVTCNTGTSPAAAIIGAIVEHLCGSPPIATDGWDPRVLPGDDGDICPWMLEALERLWHTEAGEIAAPGPADPREAPRPSLMAGSGASLSSAVYRANTIEQYIDRRLGWRADGGEGTRLIVYLDDVDRCRQEVPAAIIRLLLRFRGGRAVRFAIACDRELMERGVEDWMRDYGTNRNGRAFVTANSALEKYLDHMVKIPGLADRLAQPAGQPGTDALTAELVETLTLPRPGIGGGQEPEPILARWAGGYGTDQVPTLGEYLLTWLLCPMGVGDLLRGSPATPAAVPASAPVGAPADPSPGSDAADPSAEPDAGSAADPDAGPQRAASEGEPGAAPPPGQEDAGDGERKPDQKTSKLEPGDKKPSLIGNIVPKILTPLAESLRGLVLLQEGSTPSGKGGFLRLPPHYRDLIGSMTPRQLKFYLRARLLGSEPAERSPALTLLGQIFHAFGQLESDEPDLFRFVAAAATVALERPCTESREPGSRELTLFLNQVRALAPSSTLLTAERLEGSWPSQHQEQLLLLRLLAASHRESQPPPRAFGTRAPLPPPPGGPGRPGGPGGSLSPWTGETERRGSPLVGGQDPELTDWVRGQLGKVPTGGTVAPQVSSFQDYALDAYREGNQGIGPMIGEYVNRFLDRHAPYFEQSTATSLSNLAVLINDVVPFEAECDRLFSEARRLNPGQGSIPLYYAEFLTEVASDPARRPRLVPSRYPDPGALLVRARELIDEARPEDAVGQLYAEALGLRLLKAGGAPRNRLESEAWGLVEGRAEVFLAAAGRNDLEPITRLDGTLDAVIGRSEADLPTKGRIYAVLWGGMASCGLPTWSARLNLANNFVGQSKSESTLERLGLRINLALLQEPLLIESGRSPAVWTQCLLTWSRRFSRATEDIRQRVALGLLAALVHGGGPSWTPRAASIWQRVGGRGPVSPDALAGVLDDRQLGLYDALKENPSRAKELTGIANAVFEGDLGVAIATLADLEQATDWSDWADLKTRIARIAEQYADRHPAQMPADNSGEQGNVGDNG